MRTIVLQILVLRSGDLFERPLDALEIAFDFLGLPKWEPDASLLGEKRRKVSYEKEMAPSTRRRLEE
jgi:hypothetical protein